MAGGYSVSLARPLAQAGNDLREIYGKAGTWRTESPRRGAKPANMVAVGPLKLKAHLEMERRSEPHPVSLRENRNDLV